MSLIRIKKGLAPRIFNKARCFSTPASQEDEYTATPQYPPILDLSFEKCMERKREARYEEIKKCKTVEEKQIKLNMPRYYGFKTYMLHENQIPFKSLPLVQHVTRTHIVNNKDLPDYYKNISTENVDKISNDVKDALLMEVDGVQKLHDLRNEEISDVDRENIISSSIVKSINRVLTNSLSQQHSHILNNEIDYEPTIESSWVVGGMNPDENIKRIRKGKEHLKPFENDPIDRTFCHLSHPSLTIRSELPLPYVISPSEAENPAFEVPLYQYDPRVLGLNREHRHAANIPGFWPGHPKTFGITQYLNRGHMLERNRYITDESDQKEALQVQAILSSYAWIHAQANYLGFTTYNDITYPIVTQTVLTNGKIFNFFIYQMNTIILHSKNTTENPKRNICWASEDMQLYDEVKDGNIVGFNEEVVKLMVKLYMNEPKDRLGINLKPYLSQEEKLIADYEDVEKREWLEREYKHLVANRPRLKELDEIYAWEKIYKIDHKTRLADKRRRFFEFFERPWRRTLDDRLPKYVPRALRPDLPRHKGRRVKEYWP